MKRPKKKAKRPAKLGRARPPKKTPYKRPPRAPLSDLVHRGPSPEMSFALPVAAVPEVNGNKFASVRDITLPELWCKIEQPIHVTMLEKMRPDAPAADSARKRPAALLRVIDLDAGNAKKDLAVSLPLQKLFAVIPLDGYVGRSYRITRHRRHERKNYLGYSVEEITPGNGEEIGARD